MRTGHPQGSGADHQPDRHPARRRHSASDTAGNGTLPGRLLHLPRLGIMHDMDILTAEQSVQSLREFLQRRFRGIRGALWGDQLREEQLVEYIYLGILAMERNK